MRSTLEILLLLLSATALLVTLRGLLTGPHRDARIAIASGVVVSIGFGLGKRLAFDQATWIAPSNSAAMRLSTLMLSTLTLVLVSVGYQALRRRSRYAPFLAVLSAAPGVALVVALRAGPKLLDGSLASIWPDLVYDALLAFGAFVLPVFTFELLWMSSAWRELPPLPRLWASTHSEEEDEPDWEDGPLRRGKENGAK